MVVGDDELDPVQAALLEPEQEVAPARPALPVGELDPQHAAPAILADRHRDQHRLAADDPGLAHPLVARVEDQIGIVLLEPPAGEMARLASSRLLIALMLEAEKLWPHSSSVIAFTFRVETPCTYISARVATNAFSERW